MRIKTNAIPQIFDDANREIVCDCGGLIYVSDHLYRLWMERGIKFRCPKCDMFIVADDYRIVPD